MIEKIESWLGDIYFSEPSYLIFFDLFWVIVPLFLLILVLKWLKRPQKSRGSIYRSIGREWVWLCVILILTVSMVALAGPRSGGGYIISQSGSVDIAIVFDNSASMKSAELGRSRHEIAIAAISSFLNSKSLKPGDRITLFVFGRIAVWKMPFSKDLDDLKGKLGRTSHPDVYQDEFQLLTDLSGMLNYIPKCLDKDSVFQNVARHYDVPWFTNNRIIFLFSDGDDQERSSLDDAIRELNVRNIKVYPIAIGTPRKSKLKVRVYNADKPLAKPQEITIETALRTGELSRVAAQTGGDIFVLDSPDKNPLNFMKKAVTENRSSLPRLVRSAEKGQDIWWEILTPVSILAILFAIKFS